MRKAFTLLEVNLAIGIMAGSVLAVVILYTMGFRESRQSREDMASAAFADAVISPIVNAASSKDLAWSTFNAVQNLPDDLGWTQYMDANTGLVNKNPTALAKKVYQSVMTQLKAKDKTFPGEAAPGMLPGLVIKHTAGSSIIKIAFRSTIKRDMLLAAPLYYTEVRFQGDAER